LGFSTCAYAAAVNLGGTLDAHRLQQQMAPPSTPPTMGENYVPELREAEPDTPPPVQDGFVLAGITVTGSTVFTPDELAQTYRGSIGKDADLSTIQTIAGAMTRMYRERGYFLSRALVPAQDIEAGNARIVIIEGYVSQVRVESDDLEGLRRKDLAGFLDKITAAVIAMRPLNGNALERLLLLANDLPSIGVRAVLEPVPGETAAPGAVGMIINIERKPRDYVAQIDNFASRYTGTLQLSGTASFNNSLVAFDHASVTLLTSGSTREVKAISGAYTMPITAQGTNVGFRVGYSTINPGYTLKDLDVESEAWNIQFLFLQTLLRTRRSNVSAWATLDIANGSTTILKANLYRDRIRALRTGLQFDWNDNRSGSNSATLTLSKGLDILGASETGSLNLSRAKGHSDFTKVAASLSRLQQLGPDWQAYAATSGQYAAVPLLSSEQFGYGGQGFGRAYDPSEITGDNGVSATLEVRYNGITPWGETAFQPFAFYDIGKVWTLRDSNPEAIQSAASVGGGVKVYNNRWISGSLAAAFPLARPPSAPPSYAGSNGARVLFQLSSHF
jgi:hemolysin activation/secretion protein